MNVRDKIERLADRFSPHRFALVAITFSLGLVLAVGTFAFLRHYERDRMQVDLDRRIGNVMAFLQTSLIQSISEDSYLSPLRGLQNSTDFQDKVTEEQLRSISRPPPQVSGLEVSSIWLPVVPRRDLRAFERARSAELGKTFRVREVEKASAFGPIGSPSYALPLSYADPELGNEKVLGVDFATDPELLMALENSRDTGLPVSTGRVPLIVGGETTVDWIYFLPIYQGSEDFLSIKERRGRFIGFIGSRGHASGKAVSDFFPRDFSGIDVIIYQLADLERVGSGSSPESANTMDPIRRRNLAMLAELGHDAKIDLNGNPWAVVARPRPELIALHQTLQPYMGFVLMLLYGILFSGFLWWVLAQKGQVEALVRDRTLELEKANSELANQMAEREKAVAELDRSERYFRGLIENALDIITVIDVDGTILYESPSIERILGYTSEELIGHKVFEYLHPEDIPQVVQSLQGSLADPASIGSRRFRMRHRDGSWCHLEGIGKPLVEEGKITGGVINSRDITDQVKAEEEKRALEDQLRQSMKLESIGTLAGGIAHDFNNLLTGILGYSNLLKLNSVEGDPVHKASVVIEKAAIRGRDLTSQLLGFARKGKLQNVAVGIDATIEEVVDLLRHTVDKNIDIRMNLGAEGAYVLGDPDQIQQVFLNLAVNGRDAMPGGGVLIFETGIVDVDEAYCRVHGDIAPGPYVCLSVSDTGEGIPKDLQERIFDPFYTTKEQGQGTGMGLAMAYGSVTNHGGAIRVYSEVNEGATFKIYLPLHRTSGAEPMPDDREIPRQGRGNILLVDDEEIVREVATDILTRLGYTVVTVNDGQEAIDYYERHMDEIDLAIIDMIMPRVGGHECFLKMKGLNPEIKAVLSTGYSQDGAAQEILDEGMCGFAQKPYLATQLSEVVAKAIA